MSVANPNCKQGCRWYRASILFVAGSVACTDALLDSHAEAAGGGLDAAGVTILHQSDSVFVSQVGALAIDSSGTFYVAEQLNPSVLRYSNSGQLTAVLGKRGRGPGEFQRPGALAISGDSMLFVVDGGIDLRAWGLRDRLEHWRRPLPHRPTFTIVPFERGLLIQAPDSSRQATIGIIRGAADSIEYRGPYPTPLGRFRQVDLWFSQNVIVPLGGDSVATSIMATDFVYWGSLDHATFDSLRLPIRRRRGAGEALFRKVTGDPESVRPLLYHTSMPVGIARLSSGMLAIVHADQSYERARGRERLYLSLVDISHRRSCVDLPVSVVEEPLPRVAFRGDTLNVVTQELDADGRATVIVHKFVANLARCVWIADGEAR